MKGSEITNVNNLQVIKQIGHGSYGKVFQMVDHTTQKMYAVKILLGDAEDANSQEIKQETDLLSDCRCTYITTYFGSFYVNRDVWIVMEFVDGGSVSHLMSITAEKRMPEQFVCTIVRDVSKGLEYLHGNKKIHRDIKGANILISSQGAVKLADFGVSKILDESSKGKTFIGSPFWMAPEVIKQQDGYEYEVDIWSLGITIIEMCTGHPPFTDKTPTEAMKLIAFLKAPIALNGDFSKGLKTLVNNCLSINPKARPSAKDICKHRCISNAPSNSTLSEYVMKVMANPQSDSSRNNDAEDDEEFHTTNESVTPWAFDTVKVKNTIKLENTSGDCDTIKKNNYHASTDFDFSTIKQGSNIHLDLELDKDPINEDPLEMESRIANILQKISTNKPNYKDCSQKLLNILSKQDLIDSADTLCQQVTRKLEMYRD